VRDYYDARAKEYDDWWLGKGLFAERERPSWFEEVLGIASALASLPAARTLDVACGTGFLTKFLHGAVTGLDQSASMLRLAASRTPNAGFVQGDAFDLPFPSASFQRLVAGHFYGHLEDTARLRFLAEARRVAGELVIVDAALRDGVPATSWQDRVLNDGSRWQVYKRYFQPDLLLQEIGGGEALFAGQWFVVVRVSLHRDALGG
jgi:demethylmenaquinone methyltransferase/2-methoxy-6-polyprenyl-1,4-benzoquinol methylase